MFNNNHHLTRGVASEIPIEFQLFMWAYIDALPFKRDYFQVFELSSLDGIQRIHHYMCAIFRFIDTKGYVPYRTIRKFTQKLANAAEERGTDSAGIAYVSNGKMIISKKAKPAHKINFFFPYGTRAVLGHTRYATQGNKKFN